MLRTLALVCLSLTAVVGAACSSSGEGGRPVDVTQTDEGCSPAAVQATPGEKLNLKVKNDTGDIYEVEGIEKTALEEVIVPEGRTREVGFNVPDEGGISKIKCYQPGGVSTIIEVRAEGAGEATSPGATATASGSSAAADVTVHAELSEYRIAASTTSVVAGTVRFEADNASGSLVHELAVLLLDDDGSIGDVVGEIEDIPPGADGTLTLQMTPGKYQLACLIVPGEAGSTVDHYREGMHIDFEVN